MSKTKEQFYAEGVASARAGCTNGKMPAFGERDSWQGRAFAAGFNAELEAQRQADIAMAEDSLDTMRAHGLTFGPVNVPALVKDVPLPAAGEMLDALHNPTYRAVSSHVMDLMARADRSTCPFKAARYRAKAEIVFNRHTRG